MEYCTGGNKIIESFENPILNGNFMSLDINIFREIYFISFLTLYFKEYVFLSGQNTALFISFDLKLNSSQGAIT